MQNFAIRCRAFQLPHILKDMLEAEKAGLVWGGRDEIKNLTPNNMATFREKEGIILSEDDKMVFRHAQSGINSGRPIMPNVKEMLNFDEKYLDQKTEETENPWGDRDYPDMGDKVNDDLLDR